MKVQHILSVGTLFLASGAFAAPSVESSSSLTVSYDLQTNVVRKVTASADILAIARDWAGDGNVVTFAPAAGADKKDPSTWAAGAATTIPGTTWTPTEQRLYKLVLTAANGTAYEAYFDMTELAGAAAKTPLDGFELTLASASLSATGAPVEPGVTVSDGETTLVSGTDYEVVYANNVNVGTATAYALGKGDYDGVLSAGFQIVPMAPVEQSVAASGEINLDLRTDTVLKITTLDDLYAFAWNSSADWPAGGDGSKAVTLRAVLASGDDKEDPSTWTDGGITVLETATKEGTVAWAPEQQTLMRVELTQGGTVVNGYLDLTECKELAQAKTLEDFNATLSTNEVVCTGYAFEPDVTVKSKDGETTLVRGVDYSVTYSKNLNSGTATVTIAGIGDYQGVIVKTFTILKAVPQDRADGAFADAVTVDERVPDGTTLFVSNWRDLPTLVWNDTDDWRRDGDTNELNKVKVSMVALGTGAQTTVILDDANGEGEAGWKRLKAGSYLAVSELYKKATATDKNWSLTGTNAVRRIDINGVPGMMLLVR